MINCPLCSKELKNKRALHAHMLKSHITEYREKGCKLSEFGVSETVPQEKKEPKNKQTKKELPDDFRPLNKSDELENQAYLEGYRYIANDTVYTSTECKEMGWI